MESPSFCRILQGALGNPFPYPTEKFLPNWKKKVIIGRFTGMNGIWGA
ncbi:hypothetical protein [Acidaminococcus fermentans]|nr:hypothetical protein [Acidaminococcus fermentans]